ncbi:MAG: hypothetical protein GY870_20655, partial [archaeon]|nr:hypothetical protein [archaeon]
IFENYYKDKITVTSVENYNEKDRMKIFGTDYQKAHQNILIINPDLSVIIKEPFKKNYKDKHFKFEQSIMNTINTKKQNEQEIIDALKIVITDIFTGLNETKELIEKKVVQNEREMEIWIGKKAGKKIDVDADVLVKMYFNRFDLNVEDVFKDQGYGQNIRSI